MLGDPCPVGGTAASELNQLIDTMIGNRWRYLPAVDTVDGVLMQPAQQFTPGSVHAKRRILGKGQQDRIDVGRLTGVGARRS